MLKLQKIITIFILLGSSGSILLAKDFFPFSNYPMYSKRFEPGSTLDLRRIIGVSPDGREVQLSVASIMKPFWYASFREALFVNRDNNIIRKKLYAALLYYNKQADKLGEESLKSLRLYKFTLSWNEFVENRRQKAPLSKIEVKDKKLLMEVSL